MSLAAAPLGQTGPQVPPRPGPAGELLQLRDVGKTFHPWGRDPVRALEGVAFDVPPGAVTALIGPSGCGKSTLLRMVAGLEQPDTGSLQINGRPITGPGRDRGMVFQSYTSFPWLTVRGNVEYGLRLAGVPGARRQEIAARMIAMVQLERFADAWPSELSGGMRQRVALARALATEPEILLLDEPLGALDAQTRWSIQSLLLQIVRNTKLTALLVTHDVEEALTLAQHVVVLDANPGRVRCILSPDLTPISPENRAAVLDSPDFIACKRMLLEMVND